jgi:hypothetical protein
VVLAKMCSANASFPRLFFLPCKSVLFNDTIPIS